MNETLAADSGAILGRYLSRQCGNNLFSIFGSRRGKDIAVNPDANSPEAIDHAIQEFERALQGSLAASENKIGAMRQRIGDIDLELANLIRLAAKCDHSPSLIEAINSLEQERKTITRQLLSTEPDSVAAEVGCARLFVKGQVATLGHLIRTDVRKAKEELEKHVSKIRMVPQVTEKKGYYIAEGEWNLLGGYGEGVSNPNAERIRMVAGVGFEPTTFGL